MEGKKSLIFTDVSAVCWAMWLSRNDIVFDKVNPQPCLQILFRATYWIRFWALLQKEEDMNTISETSLSFGVHGYGDLHKKRWWFSNRLCL